MIPSYARNCPNRSAGPGKCQRPSARLVPAQRLIGVCQSTLERCEWLEFGGKCGWHGDTLNREKRGRNRLKKCPDCLREGAPRRGRHGRD